METISAASVSRQPFRDERGFGTIVFDPTRLRQAAPVLFDPAGHGDTAIPVRGQGGRGAAWFVRSDVWASPGEAVLRHYRRGGWAARFSEDAYFWRGEAAVRSLREFALLQRMRLAGLPVPAPIAAFYRRQGYFLYRAAIVVARIPNVRTFAEAVRADPHYALWATAGRAIARCHRGLARHADLNAQNILIDSDGAVFFIDWDKGCFEAATGAWCGRVLDRLDRSLRKLCGDVDSSVLGDGMRALRAAHDRELAA
jgi:3-deoxy-D-manno-octulosonic acid kinase